MTRKPSATRKAATRPPIKTDPALAADLAKIPKAQLPALNRQIAALMRKPVPAAKAQAKPVVASAEFEARLASIKPLLQAKLQEARAATAIETAKLIEARTNLEIANAALQGVRNARKACIALASSGLNMRESI